MLRKTTIIMILILITMILQQIIVWADEIYDGNYLTGLADTDEEILELEELSPKIVDVKWNSIAKNRVNDYEGSTININDINIADIGDEITLSDTSDNIETFNSGIEVQRPPFVDNSLSSFFPEIGMQEELSCVSWAYGYYQMTNNMNLLRGTYAKDSNGNNIAKNVFSPRWLYNLSNNGINGMTNTFSAISVLSNFGIPTLNEIPFYESYDYKDWYASEEIWKSATVNRIKYYASIPIGRSLETPILSCNSENLYNVKDMLLNGYVLGFPTSMALWKTDEADNGEEICWEMAGNVSEDAESKHVMTIVGYNDEIWYDVNKNGIIDSGEKGAFKIANSWGKDWCNDGYIWILYDAINKTSAIEGHYSENRRSVFNSDPYFIMPIKDYTPMFLAKLKLNTAKRNQLTVNYGVKDNETNNIIQKKGLYRYNYYSYNNGSISPTSRINSVALSGMGGEYSLNGNNYAEDGVVVFDITPAINNIILKGKTYGFFVSIYDASKDGIATIVKEFSIIDNRTNTEIQCDNINIEVDGGTEIFTVDYCMPYNVIYNDKEFSASFNYELLKSTVNNSNIYVKDCKNMKIDTDIALDGTNKIVKITPPTGGYICNKFYILSINKNVLSCGKNSLDNEFEYEFYVVGR